MAAKRRDFLRQLGIVGSAALVNSNEVLAQAFKPNQSGDEYALQKFTVNILQTTDVHCQIHPHDELFWENEKAVFRKTGGYAHLATFFKEFRKKHKYTFAIDTGDMFQGSELSYKTTGKAITPILNALNYNLFLPGNWEVIYYKKAMESLMQSLNAPKVCANMYHDKGDGTKGELIFPPYYIWQINGLKIGFLGYTDHLVPIRQSPNYSKGIIYTKPEENLAQYVEVLRNQEKCAAVMIVAHLGLSQQIHLAGLPECEGVDYILGGDTHERVRKPIQCKYAKVVEPGAFGSFVGNLSLTFENGKLINDEYELIEVNPGKLPKDLETEKLISEIEQPFLEDMNQIIGYSKIPLYRYFVIENTIDTMILDALAWKNPDVDVVLSNGFRFCPPRSTPDATGNIPITKSYVFDMLPVDSPVKMAEVSGKQMMEWLEKELNNVFAKNASERFGGWVIKFKGMEMTFEAYAEKGKRVKSVTVGGQPLQDDKKYKICACERDGDPDDMLCRIKGVKNSKLTGATLHEVMISYLKQNSPVNPVPPLSSKVLDASQNLLTQVYGVDYKFY